MNFPVTISPMHWHLQWQWQPKLKPLFVLASPAIRRRATLMAATAREPHSPSPSGRNRHRDKVVIIMGATGSGKSQLSVDLATLFPSEIINSDKMQVYMGLDITTNKIPQEDRLGIPHHLIGCVDPGEPAGGGQFTPSDFRALGHCVIGDIVSRHKLPLIAGGSNSFVYALLAERFDRCFRRHPPRRSDTWAGLDATRRVAYDDAVIEIKENTCQLAKRQIGKIQRYRDAGWDLRRLDATEALMAALLSGKGPKWAEIWQSQVLGPSAEIVKRFL